MTLTIPEGEVTGHGNDMHASQMSASYFESINPGESTTYCYIAEYAGIFKYQCSCVKIMAKAPQGHYGKDRIEKVDPANGKKKGYRSSTR
jgi:nitrite reductase (NO-forming)